MRKLKYRLTDEQWAKILKANEDVPLIMLQCGMPPTKQTRVNNVWRDICRENRIDFDSIEPDGDMKRDFKAEPLPIDTRAAQ
jgi:hypothetical protein